MQQDHEKFLNGQIVLIDKPLKWTSFDVVRKIQSLFRNNLSLKKIKIGHAGTLDPLATGLLVVCIGKFTKKIEEIQSKRKEYTGIITIGATTESFDLEKEVNNEFPIINITNEMIHSVANSFIGIQKQQSPIHSAKKIAGKRAYEYARNNQEVVIKSSEIVIDTFDILEISTNYSELQTKIDTEEPIKSNTINQFPFYTKGIHIKFRIVCSKGTYIRAIARDFGLALNSGGHLSELRRTKIGEFDVANALHINELDSLIAFKQLE